MFVRKAYWSNDAVDVKIFQPDPYNFQAYLMLIPPNVFARVYISLILVFYYYAVQLNVIETRNPIVTHCSYQLCIVESRDIIQG